MSLELIQRLASAGYPVILADGEAGAFGRLLAQISLLLPGADVTIATCAKEGCWEADVVVSGSLWDPDAGLLEKIKEVASQKVLVHLREHVGGGTPEALKRFRELLPNTAVVAISPDTHGETVDIAGPEAPRTLVATILEQAGYQIRELNPAL